MLYILLHVKVGWIKIIVKFRAEKILCTLLPCTKCPFEGNIISEKKSSGAHFFTVALAGTKSVKKT